MKRRSARRVRKMSGTLGAPKRTRRRRSSELRRPLYGGLEDNNLERHHHRSATAQHGKEVVAPLTASRRRPGAEVDDADPQKTPCAWWWAAKVWGSGLMGRQEDGYNGWSTPGSTRGVNSRGSACAGTLDLFVPPPCNRHHGPWLANSDASQRTIPAAPTLATGLTHFGSPIPNFGEHRCSRYNSLISKCRDPDLKSIMTRLRSGALRRPSGFVGAEGRGAPPGAGALGRPRKGVETCPCAPRLRPWCGEGMRRRR